MMKDKNGREIMTGDIVRINNAFFKNDNGLYFVEHSPGDVSWCGSDYCLRKVCRDGRLSTAKYNVAFWPPISCCSDRMKNAVAWEWNREHAEIEIVDEIDRSAVRDHFLERASNLAAGLERKAWDWGKHSAVYINDDKIRRHYLNVAARIA